MSWTVGNEIASASHSVAQCEQPVTQCVLKATTTRLSSSDQRKTSLWQKSMQTPQPVHVPASIVGPHSMSTFRASSLLSLPLPSPKGSGR